MAKYLIPLVVVVVVLVPLFSPHYFFGLKISRQPTTDQEKLEEDARIGLLQKQGREREEEEAVLGGYHHDLIRARKHDQDIRNSIAAAALDSDPTSFLYLLLKYYKNTYIIDPEAKVLVRVYVDPRIEALLFRCRKCSRPVPITEADWKRYEAAVERPPGLWITSLDVSKCRLWLQQNPNN